MPDATAETIEGRLELMRLMFAGRVSLDGEEKRVFIQSRQSERAITQRRRIDGLVGMTKSLPFTVPWTAFPCETCQIKDTRRHRWAFKEMKVGVQLEASRISQHGGSLTYQRRLVSMNRRHIGKLSWTFQTFSSACAQVKSGSGHLSAFHSCLDKAELRLSLRATARGCTINVCCPPYKRSFPPKSQ